MAPLKEHARTTRSCSLKYEQHLSSMHLAPALIRKKSFSLIKLLFHSFMPNSYVATVGPYRRGVLSWNASAQGENSAWRLFGDVWLEKFVHVSPVSWQDPEWCVGRRLCQGGRLPGFPLCLATSQARRPQLLWAHFPHLSDGDNYSFYFIQLWGVSELKLLTQRTMV